MSLRNMLHATSASRSTKHLIESLLIGDTECIGPLQDSILENDETMLKDLRPSSSVYVQSVKFDFVGELVSADYATVVLRRVSKVFDTGRFQDFMSRGHISESEVYPANCAVTLLTAAVIEISDWPFPLPTESRSASST